MIQNGYAANVMEMFVFLLLLSEQVDSLLSRPVLLMRRR
jgi:hypothetical protein